MTRRKIISRALPYLIVLLAAALRFHDLGAESYWVDEIGTLKLAGSSVETIIATVRDGHPPLYMLMAHFWMRLVGVSEVATRMLSALCGIAAVAMLYAVGRQLFDKKVGAISAWFMAVSEMQIYHSQEHRFYALLVFATLLSFWYYVRALRSGRARHFALYALISIAICYIHSFGIFIITAQSLYFVLRWGMYTPRRGWWLSCQLAVLLSLSPGLFFTSTKVLGGTSCTIWIDWISDHPLWYPLITLLYYLLPRPYRVPQFVKSTAIAFFIVGTLSLAIRKGRTAWLDALRGIADDLRNYAGMGDELLLTSCWLLCPILIPLVLSKVIAPVYVHRYTIGAIPAFYLLLAFGIVIMNRAVPSFIPLSALGIWILVGLRGYYTIPTNEQWHEAATYVEKNSRADDMLVIPHYPHTNRRDAFYWYYHGDMAECNLNRKLEVAEALEMTLAQCESGYSRFWLIVHEEQTERIDRADVHLIAEQKFQGVFIYLFAVTNPDGKALN